MSFQQVAWDKNLAREDLHVSLALGTVDHAPDLAEIILSRLGPAAPVNADSLSALQAILERPLRVRAGAEIAGQGGACGHVHVVRRGWACRKRWLSAGRRQITALVLPGQVADLERVMLGAAPAGVHAVTDCEVVPIALPVLRAALGRDAGLRRAFGWLFAVDASVACEWQACVGRRPAPERLAHFACEILTRTAEEPVSDGASAPFPLTQADLADLTGLSAVHVNRTLQALRADKLMMVTERRLVVLDWSALKQVAAFDPAYLHMGGMPAI